MVQVHTTFFEQPIEVDEAEAESLRGQGLLRDAPPAAPVTPPAKPAQAATEPKKES
jgi:hypothetical protein